MISRVADHCFWFGRYLERAESTARLLQVTVRDLTSWNGSVTERSLHPGQVLVAFVKARS